MVWYNKSRLKSRVCPACKRLYHLGDAPREPLDGPDGKEPTDESTRRFREQKISGICTSSSPPSTSLFAVLTVRRT